MVEKWTVCKQWFFFSFLENSSNLLTLKGHTIVTDVSGANLATNESSLNFGGDTQNRGQLPIVSKLKILKLTDIVKQIDYIEVFDPVEYKFGIILGLGLWIHCILTLKNFEKLQKLVCHIGGQIRPCDVQQSTTHELTTSNLADHSLKPLQSAKRWNLSYFGIRYGWPIS